ncbi:WxL domain-containing protein [Bacillus sp. Au-Bac7]|uniref:WxL domain-containing protein n=1 Tax=Bacillus sp. Au-Bac7 TaxID=2906458 RepID=UPI001E3F868A|nr:WxL domain-containing protein [Bacillus sp. Au-Bac7]MCE4051685.1 WxL domain-containing protein [Bacillus sp. Au-Bac7]
MVHMPTYAAENTTTTKATIVVNGGARTITTNDSVSLPAVPLSGHQQITSTELDELNLIDASGTGTAWRVDVSSTPVKAGEKSLHTGLLKLDKVQSAEKVDVTSSDVPVSTTTGQAIVDSGAVTILKADSGDGMGSYKANMGKVYLTVPANTYAGTYSVDLTYSLVTAP